jgi:hypothetical protein
MALTARGRRHPRGGHTWGRAVSEAPSPSTTVPPRCSGAASGEARARLERLGAQHAYWARRSWRNSALRRLKGCLPGGASAA